MNGDDPFWLQKSTRNRSQRKIFSVLLEGARTFTQLRTETGLSKPVLSDHLKALREQGAIEKAIENDKVVYRRTKGALKLPLLQILLFEDGVYGRLQRELSDEREAYVHKVKVTYQDEKRRERYHSLELSPQIVGKISESELIQAIDKWLTPSILYAILQELKTGHGWTKAVEGLTQKLVFLLKQKDIQRFEDILRSEYSRRLANKYFFLPSEKIPILESLDDILEFIEVHKEIETEMEESRRKRLPPFDRLRKT